LLQKDMKQKLLSNQQAWLVCVLRLAFSTITPWKMRTSVDNDYTVDYAEGWNDCIREIQKNRARYIRKSSKPL